MSGPILQNQFEHPTMLQNHDTGDWNTTIGRRNLVTGTERILAALCSNSEVCDISTLDDREQITELTQGAVRIAVSMYAELEKALNK